MAQLRRITLIFDKMIAKSRFLEYVAQLRRIALNFDQSIANHDLLDNVLKI